MPFSVPGGSSSYKNFKQITRHRLLHEMLGSCKGMDSTKWKVLIMDELTTKIMSSTCTLSDTTEHGVSLPEAIEKKRQSWPNMDAIYFIQPSKENVNLLLSDMSGKASKYRKAFIFFSSPISKDLVGRIKEDVNVLSRISALSEMNLEFRAIDSQGFVTNNERALEQLYGDKEDSYTGVLCLNEIAARVATVFASLREFPIVRYRAAKLLDATTMTTFPDLIPTKLAAGIWDCLMKYKDTIPDFPKTESCELLILDRSVDQIAPVIHEWTYDAMCHDLLNMEGNRYVLEVPSKTGGLTEKKDVLLEEHDPVWLEFRHEHIVEVIERLNEKTNFLLNSKAAEMQNSSDRDLHDQSTMQLKKIIQALPQYVRQKERLSLHSEIAGKIHSIIRDLGLQELAQLEQDLVFGYAGMKDVIKHLRTKDDTTRENKLRLLMILAAIYPEKFEGEEVHKNLIKLTKLPPCDMAAVNNIKLLGGSSENRKSSSGIFFPNFGITKNNRASRKERPNEQPWQFSSFYPIIEELIEKLSKGELSKEEYPSLNDPKPTLNQFPQPHSLRSRRTPTWAAQRGISGDGISRHASSDFKKMGKRIFVFIVGGATRSELRVCHKLTAKLNREVVLGSTSLDNPSTFITQLKTITGEVEQTRSCN